MGQGREILYCFNQSYLTCSCSTAAPGISIPQTQPRIWQSYRQWDRRWRWHRQTRCWCRAATPVPSSSSPAGSTSALLWLHGPSATSVLAGPPCAPSARAGSSGRGTAGPLHRVGSGGQQPAWAMPAAKSMPRAPCSLPAPRQVPLQGSILLILSSLPRAQQHSLLPALQGKALEAPGARARNPSL